LVIVVFLIFVAKQALNKDNIFILGEVLLLILITKPDI
jgi:hypothetical protein